MLAFLSSAWFARAAALVADTDPAPVALSGRVQFVGSRSNGDHRWGFNIVHGRLAAVVPGDLRDADVELHFVPDATRPVVLGEISGSQALKRTRVARAAHLGMPPPADLGEMAELDRLPPIVGASLVVQYELSNGPFGHVSHWIELVDGRVVDMALERHPGADVTVSVPYYAMALVRCEEMSVPEALELSEVTGSIGPIGALVGVTESPEYQAAQRATGRTAVALAALGEVWATPSFRSAWSVLAAETDPAR